MSDSTKSAENKAVPVSDSTLSVDEVIENVNLDLSDRSSEVISKIDMPKTSVGEKQGTASTDVASAKKTRKCSSRLRLR